MRYCCSFTHFSLAAFSTKGLINLITGLHLVSSPLTRDMKGATHKVSWFGKKTAWGHFLYFLQIISMPVHTCVWTVTLYVRLMILMIMHALHWVPNLTPFSLLTYVLLLLGILKVEYILQATQDKKIFCILTSITWMQQSWIPVAIILSSLFFIFQPPCHLSSITN